MGVANFISGAFFPNIMVLYGGAEFGCDFSKYRWDWCSLNKKVERPVSA